MACAVLRRQFRAKDEDSRAVTTLGRAGATRSQPRSALIGPVSARSDGFDADIRPLVRTIRRFLSNLGIIYYYLGEFDRAAELHQQSVELSPHAESGWINLADALFFAGRRDEATAAFREAARLAREGIRTDSTNEETLTYLAWAETMTGNIDEGTALAERAIERAPDDPYSHYYRALVAIRAGDVEYAADAVKNAIKLGYSRNMLKAEPYLESLRSRPDIAKLLGDIEGDTQ